MKIFEVHKYNVADVVNVKQNARSKAGQDGCQQINDISPLYYPVVNFKGAMPKKLNAQHERSKLLHYIDDLLEREPNNMSYSDILADYERRGILLMEQLKKKYDGTVSDLENMIKAGVKNPQQCKDLINAKVKELNGQKKRIDKYVHQSSAKIIQSYQNPKADETLDYRLLHLLKTNAENGNYNFNKIFKDYYAELENIHTIDELKEKYPKIVVPSRPEEVIAKKIRGVLTRDFYEKIDKFVADEDEKGLNEYLRGLIRRYLSPITEKYDVSENFLMNVLYKDITKEFVESYKIVRMRGFNTIPEKRKISIPDISKMDIEMLKLDFDKYVTTIVNVMHKNIANPNLIILEGNEGQSLAIKDAKVAGYGFGKIPDKILKILSQGEKTKQAYRDYDNFNADEFKERLTFYAGHEMALDEDILERFIWFDSSRFEPEDKVALAGMLKELDLVADGEKSMQEAFAKIKSKDYKPVGTQRYNVLEHQKQMEAMKQRQLEMSRLQEIKKHYDAVLNVLYQNDMSYAAKTFVKQIPDTFMNGEPEEAKAMLELIESHIVPNKGIILNKNELQTKLTRLEAYYDFKIGQHDELLAEKAISFAKRVDGTIDESEAGHYIMNAQLLIKYPESAKYFDNPEILRLLKGKNEGNIEPAIMSLLKYDKYTELSNEDKASVGKILDIFDENDANDKLIVKNIIEKEYLEKDTVLTTIIDSSGLNTMENVFHNNAKKQIYDKYKYPKCLEYHKAFEDAMCFYAGKTGMAGIKKISPIGEEVKIMGSSARLLSSKNNGVFDIFSDKGLH